MKISSTLQWKPEMSKCSVNVITLNSIGSLKFTVMKLITVLVIADVKVCLYFLICINIALIKVLV